MVPEDVATSIELRTAAHEGDLSEFMKLIEAGHTSRQSRTFPVHLAAIEGRMNILCYLIENKGYSHSSEDCSKKTPLHFAALHGHLKVVKYFVSEQNADPSNQDKFLRTPLHYACMGGN